VNKWTGDPKGVKNRKKSSKRKKQPGAGHACRGPKGLLKRGDKTQRRANPNGAKNTEIAFGNCKGGPMHRGRKGGKGSSFRGMAPNKENQKKKRVTDRKPQKTQTQKKKKK